MLETHLGLFEIYMGLGFGQPIIDRASLFFSSLGLRCSSTRAARG